MDRVGRKVGRGEGEAQNGGKRTDNPRRFIGQDRARKASKKMEEQ